MSARELASSATANPGRTNPIRTIGSALQGRNSMLETEVEVESDPLLTTVGALSRYIITQFCIVG